MKYKEGDKVRVRSDLVVGDRYDTWAYVSDMSVYSGKEVTISEVLSQSYRIKGDPDGFGWTDSMLEDIEFKLPGKWYVKCVTQKEVDVIEKHLYGDLHIEEYLPKFLTNSGISGAAGHNRNYYGSWTCSEITFDQFKQHVLKESKPEVEVKPEEVEFVVGKWYKNLGMDGSWIAKFHKISGPNWRCSEYIHNGVLAKGEGDLTAMFSSAEEISLQEIQQYLPTGHIDKIKPRTKKVEDLKYPDVVHCSSLEQYNKITSYIKLVCYDGDQWYLTGAYGKYHEPYDEKSSYGYVNYEFSDIIFPEEEAVEKGDEEFKIGAYIVFINDFGSSAKGDVDKIISVDSPKAIRLNKEGICWGRLGTGFSKKCKYFPTLKEAQEFSDELLGKKKIEVKHEIKMSKEELIEEAKRRYPIGTKFCNSNLINTCKLIVTITGDKFYSNTGYTNDLLIDSSSCNSSRQYSSYTIYLDGKWADVVSEPKIESKEELIYVECVKTNGNKFTLNKVYSNVIKSSADRITITEDSGERDGDYPMDGSIWKFKPSTKEAFDKQNKPATQEREELVKTKLSQGEACASCKYSGRECVKKGWCSARNGQHYPKDYIPGNRTGGYMDGVNILDRPLIHAGNMMERNPSIMPQGSYVFGIDHCNEKFPFATSLGIIPNMGMPRGLYDIPKHSEESPLDSSDDIIVKIKKTKVKQIKL